MVKKKRTEQPQLAKILDETIKISRKKNNGILNFLASVDEKGNLGRYSLAYINVNIFSADNGRVLGYDNDHGYHHRHYMGKVENVKFTNFYEIKERFEVEWREIHEKHQKKK